MLSTVGVRELRFWHHGGFDPRVREFDVLPPRELVEIQDYLQSGVEKSLPIVFSETMLYLPVAHYCLPDLTGRLVYLTDEDRELRYEGNDQMVRLLKGAAEYIPLRLVDYTKFTTEHSEFLLYAEPSEWPLFALRDDGAEIQVLKVNGNRWLYLVKTRQGPTQ